MLPVFLAFSANLWAQTEHKLIRRIVVFPIQVDSTLTHVAEENWWKLREELTRDKRFLVASRNFLKNKDVFQARGELTPADAIILGQLLDAHALVTTSLKARELAMHVYGGEYGRLLWSHKLQFNPSEPVQDQLTGGLQRLAQAFITAVPYQGFVVRDELQGTVFSDLSGQSVVKVNVGLNAQIELGDKVQFIKVRSDRLGTLFDEHLQVEVFAEGDVLERERRHVKVKIIRSTDLSHIKEGTPVRLPKELKRLQDIYALKAKVSKNIDSEYFSPGISSTEEEKNEKKPLATSLTFLINMAAFLLLAF